MDDQTAAIVEYWEKNGGYELAKLGHILYTDIGQHGTPVEAEQIKTTLTGDDFKRGLEWLVITGLVIEDPKGSGRYIAFIRSQYHLKGIPK